MKWISSTDNNFTGNIIYRLTIMHNSWDLWYWSLSVIFIVHYKKYGKRFQKRNVNFRQKILNFTSFLVLVHFQTYSSAIVLRMILGGVPVKVAMPPILAAYAVQRANVFVRRMNVSLGVVDSKSLSLLSLNNRTDSFLCLFSVLVRMLRHRQNTQGYVNQWSTDDNTLVLIIKVVTSINHDLTCTNIS